MSEIEKHFAAFMADELYGEDGFYTLGGGAGRTRDYLTSPEVGDLFGYVIADYIDSWYDSLEIDTPAIVVEAGCGPGSLAASIARAGMRNAEMIEYFLVDRSPIHLETADTKLSSMSTDYTWSTYSRIPECDLPTLVIANELFDNLVFDIGRTTDVYRPYDPDKTKVGEWAAKFGIFGNIDALRGSDVPHDLGDFRIPLHTGMVEWLSELNEATSNVTDLTLLILDYMKSVIDMHDENWLRLYADNRRIVGVENVLAALNSGFKGDITTDVTKEDVRVLLDTEGFSKVTMTTQSEWLTKHGIDIFCVSIEQPSQYNRLEAMVRGNDAPIRAESFSHERDVLTDENGLGAFSVVSARRQI